MDEQIDDVLCVLQEFWSSVSHPDGHTEAEGLHGEDF